ncbi:MAG: DoxX family protein [Bacteroidetes bacterium]|nr:DoxX family protein [Bacteroidota bacterium]
MEQTKTNNSLYRVAKGFIIFFILFSAYYSYSHAGDLAKLGFPDYFRIELVCAKILGAAALLLPFTPNRVKEWVYAGFVIAMVSALVAHISSGEPAGKIAFVSVDLVLILLSIRYVSARDRGRV